MHCQMPLDYLQAGDLAVKAGDTDYARNLYEQAEETCFEVGEFTALAHSLAAFDQDRARVTLDKAAQEARQLPEFLAMPAWRAMTWAMRRWPRLF